MTLARKLREEYERFLLDNGAKPLQGIEQFMFEVGVERTVAYMKHEVFIGVVLGFLCGIVIAAGWLS